MLTEGHYQAVRLDTGIQHIKAEKEEGNCYFCFLLITNFYENSRNSTGKLWELIKAFGKVVRY